MASLTRSRKYSSRSRSRDNIITRRSHRWYLPRALYAAGRIRETVEPVKRTLDLSARFDYDYWLRGEIRRNPQIFGIDEIAERLPADLRREIGGESAKAVSVAESSVPAAHAITDLTVKVLGNPDIYRDPGKAVHLMLGQHDTLATFFATSRQASKDVLQRTY